jgi:hypothetical protein
MHKLSIDPIAAPVVEQIFAEFLDVLLDVENVALDHTARQRWNPEDKWVFSEQSAHPKIIEKEDFDRAQVTLAGRGSKTWHKRSVSASRRRSRPGGQPGRDRQIPTFQSL